MAQRKPPTTPGKLSDTARHVVLPSGVVSTGWPAVRDTCASFGVTFDQWQDGAGRAILAKREDGKYAASVGGVVLSIPRQVGKTFLIGAIVFALCLLRPGLTVLWTAHRLKTANETFAKMQAFAKRKKIAPHVKNVRLGSGDEEIEFHNGSRIMFGARERGFGRGFDDVDVEVFDEAQILTEIAIDDMVPATNVAENPLLFFIGTPPKPSDPSEVFTRKRADALSGEDEDTVYIEFSADQGAKATDRAQWAKANPSYPHRTSETAMLRMLKNLSEESFLREGLGIWDEDLGEWFIPAAAWRVCGNNRSGISGQPLFGVAVSENREWSCIGVAGRATLSDGAQVEIVDYRPGTAWVAARAAELYREWGGRFGIVKGSPAISLIADIVHAGVPEDKVDQVSTELYAKHCGQFYDAATDEQLVHRNEGALETAVKQAVPRPFGDAWVWSQRKSSVDISPLVAVTTAFGLFVTPSPEMAAPDVILL